MLTENKVDRTKNKVYGKLTENLLKSPKGWARGVVVELTELKTRFIAPKIT